MDKPKKNIAALILAKAKPNKEDFVEKLDEPKEMDSNSVAKESAAEDLMQAMEKKDSKMFLEAFENLMYACEKKEESED